MNQEYTPFSEIIIELKKICDSRDSGTLFIATKEKRSAQIMIEKGEIVFVFFSNKRGLEALGLMSTIKAGKYRFQKGSVPSRRVPLPPTQSVLQTLAAVSGNSTLGSKSPQTPSIGRSSLTQDQKTVLEECLAEYIGPMAAILCEEHLSSLGDLSVALDLLAAEIPSRDLGEQFKEKVISKL